MLNLPIQIKFKKLDPNAIIPSYKHDFDSGFDLHSIGDYSVSQNVVTPIHTGIAVQVEFDAHVKASMRCLFSLEVQIRPRSGLGMKEGITIVNSPGTIDAGYRGELIVLLTRLIPGNFDVHQGDKIAQGVVCPVITLSEANICEVADLDKTVRGSGGFGSTGVKA